MAVPIINGNTSLLALTRGVAFQFQPTGANLPRIDATASASTDMLTFAQASPPLAAGDRVKLLPLPGETLPAPVVAGADYHLRDLTATTCKLAATSGGAAINLTTDGGFFRVFRADTWSADGLPEGLEIDPATGLISGAAALPGVYNVTLRARNTDGQSPDHIIVIGVEPSNYLQDASVELIVDLYTGKVQLAGAATTTTASGTAPEPEIQVKTGDLLAFSIGFVKSDTLVELPLEQIYFGLKEYEPERLHLLNDGSFTQIGQFEEARYQILASFEAAALRSVLSGYEDDLGTYFDAVAEIEFLTSWEHDDPPLTLRRTTRSFPVRVHRDLVRLNPNP